MKQLNPNYLSQLNHPRKPPFDTISSLSWDKTNNNIAASSWDGFVTVWSVYKDELGAKKKKIRSKFIYQNPKSKYPILCTSLNNNHIFTGNCKGICSIYNINKNKKRNLIKHKSAISCLSYVGSKKWVVTGSWDKKCQLYDLKSKKNINTFNIPERVYRLAIQKYMLVISFGLEKRAGIMIIDLRKFDKPYKLQKKTFIKGHVKSLALSKHLKWYAVGTTHGRIAVRYIHQPKKSFNFKCHRLKKINCFPVNDVCFHPIKMNMLASCGSDGFYHFWDIQKQSRIFELKKKHSCSLSCGKFNKDGSMYAYAVSYDFHRLSKSVLYKKRGHNKILIHII
jgi:mRNA export factor